MASTNNFKQAVNMASKAGTYLALIHKSDGNVEFKALRQDDLVPERLIEVKSKAGMSVDTKDSQIFVIPSANQIEFANGSNIRVIHYIEGFTNAITAQEAKYFQDLFKVVDEHKVPKGMSLPVLLFDVMDLKKSDEELLKIANLDLTSDAGFSVDYSLNDIKKLRELKEDLLKNHPIVFNECRHAIMQNQESSSVNVQNLIARYLFIEADKRGKSVLGEILSNNRVIQIIFVVGLVLMLIMQNM